MKELPTLQEVIVRRANKKLDDDMRIFRNELDKLCCYHRDITQAVLFPYSEDTTDKCSIDNLFHKIFVKDKIREKLLPWYVEKEINKMIKAIDRVPAVPKTPEE